MNGIHIQQPISMTLQQARILQKAEFVRKGSSWTFTPRRASGDAPLVCRPGKKKAKHTSLASPIVRVRDKISGVPDVKNLIQILEPCRNQWRSCPAAYRVELRRLQHRINFFSCDIGKEVSKDDLLSLQARIRSITRDMDTLGRSSSAETAMGFLPASDNPSSQPCSLRSADRQTAPIRITASPKKPAKK